jgi:hypothetical protein
MATKKKSLQAAAGSASGGEPVFVDQIFSTYLYTGNGSTQTITNGINLADEGGLVWLKSRTNAYSSRLYDTERGATESLASDETGAELTLSTGLTSFNADGFSLGSHASSNASSATHASWTFRKAPKFFDVVTFSASGDSSLTVSHNLGSTPGCILLKRLDGGTQDWYVYHRSTGASSYANLNTSDAFQTSTNVWGGVSPTDTDFTVSYFVGNSGPADYVAYLFAHNDGDGEFGESGDQDIIKCGSYTGTGAAGLEIDLGFEPQWLLVKASTISGGYWSIYDNMRGLPVGSADSRLHPNRADAENTTFGDLVTLLPNGFSPSSGSNQINQSGDTYIYIAIRRPMKTPESGTEVFAPNYTTSNQFVTTGFPVDLQIGQYTGGGNAYWVDRLRGMSTSTTGTMQYLRSASTSGESSNTGSIGFNGFVQNGFSHTLGNYGQRLWSFKRASGFFDIVCYTGDGTASRTVNHNLGVAPELMFVKKRTSSDSWAGYTEAYGGTHYIRLNTDNAVSTSSSTFDNTNPTSSVFTVDTSNWVNESGDTYVAYLFASLDGISKVGSYTGDGNATQDIDCGFSSGARFVLIKSTNATGNWFLFDTERGIVAGNDSRLELNSTSAEVTTADVIDPLASGFTVTNQSIGINVSGREYIFLAIA